MNHIGDIPKRANQDLVWSAGGKAGAPNII